MNASSGLAWREWVGAAPMEATPAETGATPTAYPTYVPIDEPPQAVAEVRPTPGYLVTPVSRALSTEAPTVTPDASTPQESGGMIALGVAIVLCCGALALGGAALVVGLLTRRQRQENRLIE